MAGRMDKTDLKKLKKEKSQTIKQNNDVEKKLYSNAKMKSVKKAEEPRKYTYFSSASSNTSPKKSVTTDMRGIRGGVSQKERQYDDAFGVKRNRLKNR